jgi:hypothetical protein
LTGLKHVIIGLTTRIVYKFEKLRFRAKDFEVVSAQYTINGNFA